MVIRSEVTDNPHGIRVNIIIMGNIYSCYLQRTFQPCIQHINILPPFPSHPFSLENKLSGSNGGHSKDRRDARPGGGDIHRRNATGLISIAIETRIAGSLRNRRRRSLNSVWPLVKGNRGWRAAWAAEGAGQTRFRWDRPAGSRCLPPFFCCPDLTAQHVNEERVGFHRRDGKSPARVIEPMRAA